MLIVIRSMQQEALLLLIMVLLVIVVGLGMELQAQDGTEIENGTPSLSVGSGGGTLSGNTLSYSNNTSTSVRRTRVTANYNGYIGFCDIEQRAGSKVYGNWSGWSVNISASPTNIAAAGGSSTITCSAVRSRQYTWNGIGQNFP